MILSALSASLPVAEAVAEALFLLGSAPLLQAARLRTAEATARTRSVLRDMIDTYKVKKHEWGFRDGEYSEMPLQLQGAKL